MILLKSLKIAPFIGGLYIFNLKPTFHRKYEKTFFSLVHCPNFHKLHTQKIKITE